MSASTGTSPPCVHAGRKGVGGSEGGGALGRGGIVGGDGDDGGGGEGGGEGGGGDGGGGAARRAAIRREVSALSFDKKAVELRRRLLREAAQARRPRAWST